MSILKKGTDFGPTEQVTSTKLDNLVDNASFTDTSGNSVPYTGSTGTCLNGGGLEVTSGGQLQIQDAGVGTSELASTSVTTAKIASSAVTTAKIADANVTNAKLATDAVSTAKITDDAVTQAKIADDAVGAAQLASNAVVTASIVDANVTTAKIADDAVTPAKTSFLGTVDTTANSTTRIISKQSDGEYDSVTPSGDATMTQAGAITIAGSAVTTSKIADLNVTTDKIADDAITSAKIADNAINSANMITGAVINTSNIVDDAVTTAKIANSSNKTTGVTFAKMQHISTSKILGRTAAGEGDVGEVSLLDEDNMSSNSATAVATQQSIKAYIDAEINKTLGFNQTWQTVTRSIDNTTSYTNNTGKPIITRLLAVKSNVGDGNRDDISIDIAITPSGGSEVYIRLIDAIGDNGYGSDIGQIVVPVGASYKFRNNNTAAALTATVHHELR